LQFITEILALLSKLKLIPDYELGYYQVYQNQINELVHSCDLGFLTSLWQIFNKGLQDLALSSNQLIIFEMLIVKAIYSKMLPSADYALTSLSNKHENLSNKKLPQIASNITSKIEFHKKLDESSELTGPSKKFATEKEIQKDSHAQTIKADPNLEDCEVLCIKVPSVPSDKFSY
jgi:DNA polymerase-3 subunit gamma/tau